MDSHEIKKIAKEYKEENGNSKVTSNELLWYTLHRVDQLSSVAVTKDQCAEKRGSYAGIRANLISVAALVISACAVVFPIIIPIIFTGGN